MKTKNILVGIGIVAFLGILFWVGRNNTKQVERVEGPRVESSLTANTSSYDFGTIRMKDGNVEKVFEVKNEGDKEIRFANVFTSCMCTTAYLEKGGERQGPFGMPGHGPSARPRISVAPGEMLRVRVVFDPNAHGPAGVGLMERTIHLVEENGAEETFSIRSMVTP